MESRRADFIQQWEQAARPLLLIDEVRIDGPPSIKQFIFFIVLRTDTKMAVDWLRDASKIRGAMPPQSRDATLKGSRLFGTSPSQQHEALREYVFRCVRSSRGLDVLGTSSVALTALSKTTSGGIQAVPAPDEVRAGAAVRGRELVLVLNLLKRVATEGGIRGQIDVVVDRSRQLGLAPVDRGIKESEFETLGPSDLNALVGGGQADLCCDATFRIVSVSDEGPFRDLVLLPDAVGYIGGYCGTAFDGVKAKLETGESTWYWQAALQSLRSS